MRTYEVILKKLESDIEKQKVKAEALKSKSMAANDKYNEACKKLNKLKNDYESTLIQESCNKLLKACEDKKLDINNITEIIESGEFDTLVSTIVNSNEAHKLQ